jgi:hypothetical protein
MDLENMADLSEWSKNFSPNQILSGNFEAFEALFYLIIMLAIYSVVIYHFYRYIAQRDCFTQSNYEHTRFIGFCKYFFLFPFVAVLFFLGFSLILISLTKTESYNISNVLSLSFAIVLTIRITAYYTEDLSKDVAKMLPFAVLGVFLVDSTYFSFQALVERISLLPESVNLILQFLIMIIIVEWILRFVLSIRYKLLLRKEKKLLED